MSVGDSQSQNLGLVVTPDHQIKMSSFDIPTPGPGQVLIKMKANGICGSDVHFWKDGKIGELKVLGEYVLGHEGAGEIVRCGDEVTSLKAGDRVAIEPLKPCMACQPCISGSTNLCKDVEFSGVYPYPGSIREYHVCSAKLVHKLPLNISYASGALLEPLSVVLHALTQVNIQIGRPLLVCGAGPIGLVAVACARAQGASPIVVTDVASKRLDFAKTFSPGVRTYQFQTSLSPEENAEQIKSVFRERLPEIALECTGVESSIHTAIFSVQPRGKVLVVGVGKPEIRIPFMQLSMWEISLLFTQRYYDTWPAGIAALSSGVLDLESLVTHRYLLKDSVAAMEVAANPEVGGIKVHVVDTL